MSRLLPYALGPELLWALIVMVSDVVARRNVPPTPSGTAFLERAAVLWPAVGVPLTFLVFALPGQNRWVMLARVVVALTIGLNLSLFALIGRIDYGDSRNSGTLGFWVIGLLVGIVAFVVAGAVTIFVLRATAAKGGQP